MNHHRFARSLALGLTLLMTSTFATPPVDTPADPHLWLEDVTGAQPLAWVRERNAESTRALTSGTAFPALERRILSILGR